MELSSRARVAHPDSGLNRKVRRHALLSSRSWRSRRSIRSWHANHFEVFNHRDQGGRRSWVGELAHWGRMPDGKRTDA
jgi:hypothetical protein